MSESAGPASADAARVRLAEAQTALLSALVAGAAAPEGFDLARLDIQRRALRGKRADVVAKLAPELPAILGEAEYRTAFAAYATGRPMTANYRWDALHFAAHMVRHGGLPRARRKRLKRWHAERSGPTPPER
ncbi:hypothetical protein GCM10009863_52200 [Streptomyces axinellae]|uniref:SCO6045-like C-terminal domain-containing protein n=1 Tax=Streptomyces axinellae TaxID=552788 RepID=A0ABN3QMB5_9ACTN